MPRRAGTRPTDAVALTSWPPGARQAGQAPNPGRARVAADSSCRQGDGGSMSLDEQHDKGRREVKTTTDGMIRSGLLPFGPSPRGAEPNRIPGVRYSEPRGVGNCPGKGALMMTRSQLAPTKLDKRVARAVARHASPAVERPAR